jgi:hypothetical protein
MTTVALGDKLDDGLGWRKTELASIKAAIQAIPATEISLPTGRALLRSGAALLYAHWEGYTKDCCQSYLDYVAGRRLKLGELNDAFVMLGARGAATASQSGDPSAVVRLLELVRRGSELRPKINRHNVVNTRSNLRHGVLCEIFDTLGLPVDHFELKVALIDRSLCDMRNEISHGRHSCPTPVDYLALHDEVIQWMTAVRDIVLDAAANKRYLAPP